MKNGREALILQPRDQLLLHFLAELRILDRSQIERLAGFGSISRVNVRLARLRGNGLILRYFTATSTGSRRSIYALSKQGAREVSTPYRPLKWPSDTIVLGNAFVAHQLTLNDLYIRAMKEGIRWQRPDKPLVPAVPLIPDAYMKDASTSFFVELDLGTEALPVWTRKVTEYLKLAVSGTYLQIIPHSFFAVLIVANSEKRLRSLRQQVAKQTQKLFWFATLETINRQGFWSVSWLRATGDHLSFPGA
ncbi:MAG: replication-relaxation family protein [Acidobacteriota bacterium]